MHKQVDFSSYFSSVCEVYISQSLIQSNHFYPYLKALEDIEARFNEDGLETNHNRPLVVIADTEEMPELLKKMRKRAGTWFLNYGVSKNTKKSIINLFDLHFDNDKEFSHILQMISQDALKFEIQRLREFSFETFEMVMKESLHFQNNFSSQDIYEVKDTCVELIKNFGKMATTSSLDEFIRETNKLIKIHDILESIEIIEERELIFYQNQEAVLVLPIIDFEPNSYLCFKLKDEYLGGIDAYYVSIILDEIEAFLESEAQHNILKRKNVLLEESFARIPLPLALISSTGELLLHNSGFSRLRILPKDCISFVDGQEVEAGAVYKVQRIDIDSYSSFFIFSSDGQSSQSVEIKNISSEELGIISSSIAHELNNPLAGILAALTLLSMEEGWDEEALISLQDMKNGASRCKELIEIFLGFSKASPRADVDLNVEHAFEKAVELLRFRMIESQVRLDVKVEKSRTQFEKGANASIMSMIFYLILSEVMTEFSHLQLVRSGEGPMDNVIYGSFKQTKKRLEISLGEDLESIQRIHKSKLINHLVELEGLKLNLKPSSISLMSKS